MQNYNMNFIKKVMVIAADAHGGQFRGDGSPYIMHPCSVQENFYAMVHKQPGNADDNTRLVSAACLLHDVIEDCMPAEDLFVKLVAANISCEDADKIVAIVKSVTHIKGTDYKEYVDGLNDETSLLVKYCDIKHNLQCSMEELSKDFTDAKALKRVAKYTSVLPMIKFKLKVFGWNV